MLGSWDDQHLGEIGVTERREELSRLMAWLDCNQQGIPDKRPLGEWLARAETFSRQHV